MRSSGSSTLHLNRKWRVEFHLDRATLSNFTNIHFPQKRKEWAPISSASTPSYGG